LNLKTLVGLKTLVEGLGIGIGKQYHTSLYVDYVKSTHAIPIRIEILVGKL